jgi:aspartate aminotransferase
MKISKIASSIGESATLKLNAQAAALKAQGEPLIHLAGGEPKSKAPVEALNKAIEMINTGEVRYTPASGIPSLKKAVIRYTKDFYHVDVEESNVLISTGAKQSIMVAMQAVLDPGDEVIFPAPYWVSYPDMVRLCGAVSVPVVPLNASLIPTMYDFKKAYSSKCKMMIINNPSNPGGILYPETLIAEVVRFCEENNICLIMDDIYHRLLFNGKKAANCFSYTQNAVNDSNIIVINGVSKQYAMTGFRIGWAVGSKSIIKIMGNIVGHQTSGASSPSQVAAEAAILGSQESVTDLTASLQLNRDVLVDRLKMIKHVRFNIPDGTFYCFVNFSDYCSDSSALSALLLDKVKVLTVPGIEFGMEGYLRLSTCGSTEDIIEGTRRIAWALDSEKGSEITIGNYTVVKDWSF